MNREFYWSNSMLDTWSIFTTYTEVREAVETILKAKSNQFVQRCTRKRRGNRNVIPLSAENLLNVLNDLRICIDQIAQSISETPLYSKWVAMDNSLILQSTCIQVRTEMFDYYAWRDSKRRPRSNKPAEILSSQILPDSSKEPKNEDEKNKS